MNQEYGIMTRFEQDAHSFVIRVWQENQEDATEKVVWRGWVEYVPTGQRHYFQEPENLCKIMSIYLDKLPDLAFLIPNLKNG